jgi:O-antigen ligase
VRAVLAILVISLVAKDLAFVPSPYVLRGAAQMLCLIAGTSALLRVLSPKQLLRYWPLVAYLMVLLVTVPFTQSPLFVLLQIGSLFSAIILAVGYFEGGSASVDVKLRWLVFWIIVVYGIVCAACLILIRLDPSQAYESMLVGDLEGYELRFRGLFSKSAQMGAAGGLLAGLALMRVRRLPLKILLTTIGFACLVLPQCRSFWVAAFVAGGVTTWIYYKHLRKWVVATGAVTALTLIVVGAFQIPINLQSAAAYSRVNTIGTLTGRTALWAAAYKGWAHRPLLGYGFTLGGTGLDFDPRAPSYTKPQELSRRTLHSGYVQSLLDSGLVGFAFYMSSILYALYRAWRNDPERKFPEVLYVLMFLAIANGGESVIYSGAVFQSLCFWIFAAFAMTLRRPQQSLTRGDTSGRIDDYQRTTTRPGNLLR